MEGGGEPGKGAELCGTSAVLLVLELVMRLQQGGSTLGASSATSSRRAQTRFGMATYKAGLNSIQRGESPQTKTYAHMHSFKGFENVDADQDLPTTKMQGALARITGEPVEQKLD